MAIETMIDSSRGFGGIRTSRPCKETDQTRKHVGAFQAKALDKRGHDRYTVRAMIIDGRHRRPWQTDPSGPIHSHLIQSLLRLAGQPGRRLLCPSPQLVHSRRVSSCMGVYEPLTTRMRLLCGPACHHVPVGSARYWTHRPRPRARLDVCYKPASSISATYHSAGHAAMIRWPCLWSGMHTAKMLDGCPATHTEGGSAGSRVRPTEDSVAHIRILRYARCTTCRLRGGGSRSSSDSSHADKAKGWPPPSPSAIELRSRSTDA